MASKSEAYVDTSALIALCDRSDDHHALFRRLFSAPPNLVTTGCWSTDRHLGLTGVPLVIHKGRAVHDRRVKRPRATSR